MIEDKLDKLIEEAVNVREIKKIYERKYRELRKEIKELLENELYADEYITASGTRIVISTFKKKKINPEKIKELIEIAKKAGYEIKEDDLYIEEEYERFEILTPADIRRKRKFAEAKK